MEETNRKRNGCFEITDTGAVAVGYCRECEEDLCQRCFEIHKTPKPSRNHTLVPINCPQLNTNTKPALDVTEIACDTHRAYKTELYCHNHKTSCCAYCCLDEHKNCDVKKVCEVETSIIYSNEVENYLSTLKETKDVAIDLSSKIDYNCQEIRKSHLKCQEETVQFRKELDHRLNDLQRDTDTVLEEKHQIPVAKQCCENLLKMVTKKISDLEMYQENKLSGTMYVALQGSQDQIQFIQEKLNFVKSNMTIQTYDFVPDRQLRSSLFQDVASFGSLDERAVGSDEDRLPNCSFVATKTLTKHEVFLKLQLIKSKQL